MWALPPLNLLAIVAAELISGAFGTNFGKQNFSRAGPRGSRKNVLDQRPSFDDLTRFPKSARQSDADVAPFGKPLVRHAQYLQTILMPAVSDVLTGQHERAIWCVSGSAVYDGFQDGARLDRSSADYEKFCPQQRR